MVRNISGAAYAMCRNTGLSLKASTAALCLHGIIQSTASRVQIRPCITENQRNLRCAILCEFKVPWTLANQSQGSFFSAERPGLTVVTQGGNFLQRPEGASRVESPKTSPIEFPAGLNCSPSKQCTVCHGFMWIRQHSYFYS